MIINCGFYNTCLIIERVYEINQVFQFACKFLKTNKNIFGQTGVEKRKSES